MRPQSNGVDKLRARVLKDPAMTTILKDRWLSAVNRISTNGHRNWIWRVWGHVVRPQSNGVDKLRARVLKDPPGDPSNAAEAKRGGSELGSVNRVSPWRPGGSLVALRCFLWLFGSSL